MFFQSEQLLALVGIALVGFLLIVGLVSWWLVRRFWPKSGRKALFLIPAPFLLLALLFYAEYLHGRPVTGPPHEVALSKIPKKIRSLPNYASFGYAGIAYFDHKLYATTNLGLFEFVKGKLQRVFCPQKQYCVVSGPWIDPADHLLWIMDEQTNEFLNFDGQRWTRVPMPQPEKGYYSRGDVMEGARIVGTPLGFWLASGGSMWRWNPAGKSWTFLAGVKPDYSRVDYIHELAGVLALGNDAFGILRHEPLSFLSHEDEDNFQSDRIGKFDGSWHEIPNAEGLRFEAVSSVVEDETGLICTKNGRVVKVTRQKVEEIPAPGVCEVVATGSGGRMLGSFKSKGLFSYSNGSWAKVLEALYASGAGEYRAGIAEDGNELAYDIDASPVIDKSGSEGDKVTFTRNAPTKLWIVVNGRANEITY